ncbi:MAG: MBL fold metallo-hydrolase [Fimbriimonadaceae bacterium]|nr:MBL fold metallo-hydrolase [Fimbriimonadaceae bacterium]
MRPLSGAAIVGGLLATGLVCGRMQNAFESRISFVSVGQGDCTVFQHEGRTVVIDVAARTDSFDAGERLVAPELYRLGVSTIDILILTHPDSDHVGGLPSVARRFGIGKVVIPARFRHHKDMNDWLRRAEIEPKSVVWLEHVTEIKLGPYRLTMDALTDEDLVQDNDGSMFCRIVGPKFSAVLTGDASSDAERRMLAKGGDWSGQIFKAGHHGSRFSSSAQWLEAVRPTVCILSAGRNNVYGHPSPDVLSRLERLNIQALRTDRDGTITFDLSVSGARRSKR